jgi:RimJ/RimL family protein N-acetyltransferase
LYLAQARDDLIINWRNQGVTQSFEAFAQALWSGVTAQFLVIRNTDRHPVGHVSLYNVNFRHGWGYIAVANLAPHENRRIFWDGVGLFIDYVFRQFGLRKIYAEIPGYNYEELASGAATFFVVEGRLTDHYFAFDRYWDLHLISIDRERWSEWSGTDDIAHLSRVRRARLRWRDAEASRPCDLCPAGDRGALATSRRLGSPSRPTADGGFGSRFPGNGSLESLL